MNENRVYCACVRSRLQANGIQICAGEMQIGRHSARFF